MSTYFKEEQDRIETNDSIFFRIWRNYQSLNDKIQFYRTERWSLIGFLALIFFLRIYFTQGKNINNKGYYAVTYCLGIHILNSFIGFISPLQDPEDEECSLDDKNSFLPQKTSEEFRPFQRKIKEFEFWNCAFWAFSICIILTFFESFNVPVYWPLLLFYFILIFFYTMKRQILHMYKYNYVPYDAGKKKYGNK